MSEPTEADKRSVQPLVEGTMLQSTSADIKTDPLAALAPGDRVDDFQIVRELGRGGFASVYLARQLSLDRLVALKFSEHRGLGEGQALAELEHDHIVKVYSEFVDPISKRHCLCLQFVPGTDLNSVIRHLHRDKRIPQSGGELLNSVDTLNSDPVGLDPSALPNREILLKSTFTEAVCLLGLQLAQALSFAHARKILHCDIKPANILVNHYGRPMLADFNVAIDPRNEIGLGGTRDYMSPEHLRALIGRDHKTAQLIDARSDIYSLGIVLFELSTGYLPFPAFKLSAGRLPFPATEVSNPESDLVDQRERLPEPTLRRLQEMPAPLARVIQRCLQFDPNDRYQSGMELASALANARELLRIERRLPSPGRITRFAQQHLLTALLLLALFPNVLASIINISYNGVEIELSDLQKNLFRNLVYGYNLIAYPVCIAIMIHLLRRFFSQWNHLATPSGLSNEEMNHLRKLVLRFSYYTIALAAFGWFPGGLIFPVLIDWIEGPLTWKIYAHFLISFSLSGLIAMIYTFFGVHWIVLRVVYPRVDIPDRDRGSPIEEELKPTHQWLAIFQVLSGLVPLIGAILMILLAEGSITLYFQLLASGLILLGVLGVGIAIMLSTRMSKVLQVMEDVQSIPGTTVSPESSDILRSQKIDLRKK
jgi:eukaryotic-like serine/threonine-protein kinase